MSDTNRTAIKFVRETEYGVIPESPALKELRNTGAPGFGYNPTTIESNEIRPDRQVSDVVTVGAEPGGDINMELSYETVDDLFEGALQREWEKQYISAAGDILSATGTSVVFQTDKNKFVAGDVILANYPNGETVIYTATEASDDTLTIDKAFVNADKAAEVTFKKVGFKGASGDIQALAGEKNGLQSTVLNFKTLGLKEGQWIKIGNSEIADNSFVTSADNGLVRISEIQEKFLYFSIVPKGWAADDGSGKTIEFYIGDFLKNAEKVIDPTVTQDIISYTIEQSFLDHKPIDYQYIYGMIVDSLSMSMTAAAFVELSSTFMGATASATTSRITGATDISANDNPVMNTSSNVAQIARGKSKIEGANYVSDLSLEINNNCRRRNAVGVFGTQSIGLGEFAVTGTMTTYFSNAELLQTLINNEETSLNYALHDNRKHMYLFDLPRVKYSSGNPEVGGKNEDVMLSLEYQAIRDGDLGYTLGITKFDYVN